MKKKSGEAPMIKSLLGRMLGKDILGILGHSKNYFFSIAFTQGLFFLVMPLLTRILPPADYGIYQVFRSYAEIFVILLTLNFHGAVSRYYYDDKPDLKEFVGASFTGSAAILLGVALVYFVFPGKIAELLTIPENLTWLLLILTFIKILESIFNQLCIASKKSFDYSITNNVRAVLALGAGIAFALVIRQDKYYGLAIGQTLGSVIVGIYILFLLRDRIGFRFKKEHILFIVGYSLPLVPYTLSSMFLEKFDRILINKILDANSAGLYSFAYSIGMMVSIVTDSLNGAFIPDWFRLMREEKYEEVNVLTLKMFRIVLLVAMGAVLFSQEVFSLLSSSEYHAALLILPIVIVGYVFEFFSKVYLRNLGLAKKMVHASLLGILTVVLNFSLNVIFLPRYGYVAAAYSTLASFTFLTVSAWVTAKYILKHVVVPWQIFLRPTLFFTLSLVAYYLIMGSGAPLIQLLVLKALVLILFSLVILFDENIFKIRRRSDG